jgi:hypothetical protein
LRNKLFIGFILVVLLFVTIAGCSSTGSPSGNTPTATPTPGPGVTTAPTAVPTISASDPILGKWTAKMGDKTYTWEFKADGSAVYNNGTIEYLPAKSLTRLDDTHYNVVGKSITSELIFDQNHTQFYFVVLPAMSFTKVHN